MCGKSYLQYSHLKVHASLHTKDKPYQCGVCQKPFRLLRSFREHVNMHRNVKNFKCSQCAYATCFRKNLHAHVKNHLKKQGNHGKEAKAETESKAVPDTNDNKAKTEKKEKIKIESTLELEEESPVYLFVNVTEGAFREQIFSIEDIERLDPLAMAQELSITTQPHDYEEKYKSDEYRPLDLSVVPAPIPDKLALNLKPAPAFFSTSGEVESPVYTETTTSFPAYTGETIEFGSPPEEESPAGLSEGFPDFTVDNSGRRRSVFLAEQLEYEHQGEMRVVDPAEVTR